VHDFEFQRYVTVGQYLATDSPLHHLDPRARLVSGALLLIAITAAPHLSGLGLALVVVLLALVAARIPLSYALRGLVAPLPFILFLALLQILFGSPGNEFPAWFTLGPLHTSKMDLLIGSIIIVRFAALILLISLTSAIISTSELVHSLQALLRPLATLGIPTQDLVLMAQVTLRFLPLLALEAERIAKAQASRGAEWGVKKKGLANRIRQVVPMVLPLFITSLRRSENLALAMDARAYGVLDKRTSMTEPHFNWKDASAILIGITVSLAIFLV